MHHLTEKKEYGSSLAVYDNEVLALHENWRQKPTGLLIENNLVSF